MGIEKQMNRRRAMIPVKPMQAEGMQMLAHRHGGTEPLPVLETSPGIFASAWAIHHKDIARLLKSGDPCTLQLVIDTNVPGHPSLSMKVVPIDIVKG